MEEEVGKALNGEENISEDLLINSGFVRELANAARESENREKLLSGNKFSGAKWKNDLSAELMIELCRLFGNLCFNNPKGRQVVKDIDLLNKMSDSLDNMEGPDLLNTKLILVLPAFLQNFCIDNSENIHLTSAILKAMSKLISSGEKLDENSLSSLEDLLIVLSDADQGAPLFDNLLIQTCVAVIKTAGSEINSDLVTSLITLAEDDTKCRFFLEHGLHTVLFSNLDAGLYSLEKEEDELKSAKELMCEFLAMVTSSALLEEISLPLLLSWLKKDDILCSTAFLILGNLCTSDENTEAIATPEFVDSAIEKLSNRNKAVRHALLGCIRNCAVNPKSRDLLVSKDLGSDLLVISADIDDPGLMQKLVSILRLLALCSDSVARKVGEEETFIEKLVHMGKIENQFSAALGQLNVETGRLFSTVIVKTQNPAIMRTVLDKSGLPHLLSLLSSPHLVMLNQAVLPLCLLFTLDPLPSNLYTEITPEVVTKILGILEIKKPADGYRMVHENVLKLLTVMIGCKNDQTLKIIRDCDVKGKIEKYKSNLDPEIHEMEDNLSQQIITKLTL